MSSLTSDESAMVDGFCVEGVVKDYDDSGVPIVTILRAAGASGLFYARPRSDGEESWKRSIVPCDEDMSDDEPANDNDNDNDDDDDDDDDNDDDVSFTTAFRFLAVSRFDAVRFRCELHSSIGAAGVESKVAAPNIHGLSPSRFSPALHEAVDASHFTRWSPLLEVIDTFGEWYFPTAADFAVFAGSLRHDETVRSLLLNNCDFLDANGAAALAEALRVNKTMTRVEIGANKISDFGAVAVAGALGASQSLTALHLELVEMGETGAFAIAEALKINKSLVDINISQNDIGPEGASAIAEALKVNKTLRVINMLNIGMGPKGAIAFSEALKLNRSLRKAYLGSNAIGFEGASALAEALKVNETLAVIDVVFSEIEPEGANALVEALAVNKSLTTALLRENPMDAQGHMALAETLRVNETLTRIDACINGIGADGINALAGAIRVNGTLCTLLVQGGRLPATEFSTLVEAVDANPVVPVHLTPEQRLSFLMGHVRKPRPGEPASLVRRLPLDIIKRILLGYRVAQGSRFFYFGGMETKNVGSSNQGFDPPLPPPPRQVVRSAFPAAAGGSL